MPGTAVLLDELKTESLICAVADDTRAMTSELRIAGDAYPWAELLPGIVARTLDLLLSGADPTDEDRSRIAAAAQRCARDWVPLTELERCCHALLTCVFAQLWREAECSACARLLLLSGRAAEALPTVLGWVRHAYVEELRSDGGGRVEARLIAGLLDGQDTSALAAEAGIGIPAPGAVACVVPVQGPEGRASAFGRAPSELRGELGDGALCAPTPDGAHLVAFLPVPVDGEAGIAERGARLASACSGEYAHGCVAGMAHVPGPGEAATALREAMWAADLMARGGRGGQAMFLLDLMPEAVIAERADLRERLLSRLAAVRARHQLWRTLRTLYDCDLDRGRTARWLGIHRSTLDYRLNCVQRLTGISPTSVRGIVLLSAALAADTLAL